MHLDHPSGGNALCRGSREALMAWFIATMERFRQVTQEARRRNDTDERADRI